MELFERLIDRTRAEWRPADAAELRQYIDPKIAQGLGLEKLDELLAQNQVLNLKLGIDPTGSEIHIGHMVPMLLLDLFGRAGHHIDYIVGDFTGQVGDPTGRETARAVITRDTIRANMETYAAQTGTVVNINSWHIRYNSTWLENLRFANLLGVLQKMSMSTVMQRDDFRKRMENGQPVSLAESLYGIMMGYDSVELNTDIELGGLDQFLNFVQCRELQQLHGQTPEIALCTPIIEGTDGTGRKMSKSYGNYIPLTASDEEKFGKVMSIPDHIILQWFQAFTFIRSDELAQLQDFIMANPLEAKKWLGVCLIALQTKSADSGLIQRERFEKKFAEREITRADCEEIPAAATWFDTLVPSFESKSELRRLFEQNAVRDQKSDAIVNMTDAPTMQTIIRVGKRRFFWIQEN